MGHHHHHVHDRPPPKALVAGIAMLIGVALLAAAIGGNRASVKPPGGARRLVLSQELHFRDLHQGAIGVYRAGEDGELIRLAPGSNGFLRSVLRGLARERRARGLGPEAPFVLIRWSDGSLSLDDPATDRRIELVAFGPTNLAAFGRLLDLATSSDIAAADRR